MRTHIYTHTHTHTHTCMNTWACARAHTHTHAWTHTWVCVRAPTHTHTHTHTEYWCRVARTSPPHLHLYKHQFFVILCTYYTYVVLFWHDAGRKCLTTSCCSPIMRTVRYLSARWKKKPTCMLSLSTTIIPRPLRNWLYNESNPNHFIRQRLAWEVNFSLLRTGLTEGS